ncbi:MAG TPA: hypothetical protein VMU83_11295 [Hanamia sp.]|nr:hypothetical protein [Hanamia sp.]
MKARTIKKNKNELVPGTLIKCESGRFIAFYEHRTDIIANGDNEVEAKKNLRIMYKIVTKHENATSEKPSLELPKNYKTIKFTDKLTIV